MVNVVCIKHGTKYNSTQVNFLYKMVARNLSLPFFFYCFTDDPIELDSKIIPVLLDDDLDLETFWWKIEVFKSDKYDNIGPTLFLDIDVIIQNNIDYLFELVEKNKLVTTDQGIIDHEIDAYPYEAQLNSSIMIFNSNEVDFIYDRFISNKDYFIIKYRGLCRYLTHEHLNDIELKLKPFIDFYSFLSRPSNISSESVDKWRVPGKYRHFYKPDCPICLLNGVTRDSNVLRYAIDFFSYCYK